MDDRVPQRAVLNVFHLLKRIDPAARVVGTAEIARIGDHVFALSLAPTIRDEAYDGLSLRVVHPKHGELHRTWLGFDDHGVNTGTGTDQRKLETVDRYNHRRVIEGVDVSQLEAAIREYVEVFSGAAKPRSAEVTPAA